MEFFKFCMTKANLWEGSRKNIHWSWNHSAFISYFSERLKYPRTDRWIFDILFLDIVQHYHLKAPARLVNKTPPPFRNLIWSVLDLFLRSKRGTPLWALICRNSFFPYWNFGICNSLSPVFRPFTPSPSTSKCPSYNDRFDGLVDIFFGEGVVSPKVEPKSLVSLYGVFLNMPFLLPFFIKNVVTVRYKSIGTAFEFFHRFNAFRLNGASFTTFWLFLSKCYFLYIMPS